MENETNGTTITDKEDSERSVVMRGVILTLLSTITTLSLWIIIILSRCKHTAPQFKLLYSNLFAADGVFAVTLILHLAISSTSLPVCVISFVMVTGAYNVYLFTVIAILLDRMVSLLKVTPFLLKLSTKSIATIVTAIWLLSVLIVGLASLDLQNNNICNMTMETIGIIGSLTILSFIVVLITLCVALMVAIIILQREHIKIMANAPVEMHRHRIGEYVKTTLKEIPVCAFTLLLYVPWVIRHVMYVTNDERPDVRIVITPLTTTVKLFSSVIICAIRFPEFRYKMPSFTLPCCGRVQRWSADNLEIYYPTISDINDLAVEADFGIYMPNTQGSTATTGCQINREMDDSLRIREQSNSTATNG